ncbi:MAG: FGGY family carbohydrate kinase, partial [Gemmataceae bacterium]
PTDLWTTDGVSELNLLQLEGQARASTRLMATKLRALGRLHDWRLGGISATHHTNGRIDAEGNPIRRAICWNDQTLGAYHTAGEKRLGGPVAVAEKLGGPWAVRYSLSHLVKDEATLSPADWQGTRWLLPHGSLAAGYLTGNFGTASVSAAASTGMMDLRTNQWQPAMLDALENAAWRTSVLQCLPRIVGLHEPLGSVRADLLPDMPIRPILYPTLDDQAAGLVGGGAVDAGQVAIILGNSAVVNSSASSAPQNSNLDAMKLDWGPFLWMRCYSNGAQFLDRIVGPKPDWKQLELAASAVAPGCGGVGVMPFVLSEPSLGLHVPRTGWHPAEPKDPGVRF